jgi:DNA (cytosine-5)-methyltransferase 1
VKLRKKSIQIADLFCGAGGTTTGGAEAARRLGFTPKVTAVNHWPIAVQTHSANHPDARHLCASLDSINPRDLFDEGELDLLLASPECMSHSNARGGRPVNDQSRATAWCVLRWADALRPPQILIENVPEFEHWAPIGSNGRPLKSKRGQIFQSWCDTLRSLGYTVGHRVLCAADYGDPTTRRRLFIQAVRGRRKIVWPHATHTSDVTPGLFGAAGRPWVAARQIIDWKLKGKSIFGRKKSLSQKTLDRIFGGLQRFGLKPFVVAWDQQSAARAEWPVDLPLPTVVTKARHGVAEPYLVQVNHGNGKDKKANGRRAKSVDGPLPTVCGVRGEWAVCEPFILPQNTGNNPRPVSSPAPTLTTTSRGVALVEPMMLPQHSGGELRPVSQPVSTIATAGAIGLIEPYIVEFYGNGQTQKTSDPLPTVTTKDRFGLAHPTIELHGQRYVLDILFRMLQPHELAAAQGFPAGYQFTGTKTDVVKQIGNAVPRRLARALVAAMLSQNADVSDLADDEAAVEGRAA